MEAGETQLVGRARAGDRVAFEALATAAFPALVRLCGSLEGDRERALDLAQEALCRALAAIAEFRGEASFATWVRKIARNLFLKDRARAARRRERGAEPEALDAHASKVEEDPAARAARVERAGRVRAALETLPDEQRTALILCDRDGASYKEIAGVMGCPLGTVMWRIHAARKRLRAALAGEADAIEGRPA